MKKRLFTLMSLLMCGIMLVGMMTACGPKRAKEDPTKSHLYVYNYNGGVGTSWLTDKEKEFEEFYKGYSFEEGKTGVDVHVTPGKNKITDIKGSKYNIIFDESLPVNDYIQQELLLNINDVVNTPLTEFGENKKILDKIPTNEQAAYTAKDGNWYYLPHYEAYYGITYDRKVFEDFNLFFKQGSGWTNGLGDNKELLSVGPDGKKGTYDDGLPSSIEEFGKLMDRMVLVGVVPFIWSGANTHYFNSLVAGVWASYSGADQLLLNVNFDSNAVEGKTVYNESVTGVEGGEPIIRQDVINTQNGYLTSWQVGKYYGFQIVNKIMSDNRNYSDLITGTLTHLEAQQEYIYSDLENKPIGMFIDGSYWYNEAKSAFARSVSDYPAKAKNRNFQWMPLPTQAKGQVVENGGKKNTMISALPCYCIVNGNIASDPVKVDIAKKFVMFNYTDKALQDFTISTNVRKGVDYSLTSKQTETLNSFAKSIYVMTQECDIVRPVSDNPIFVNASSKFRFAGDSDIYTVKDKNGASYLHIYEALNARVNWQEAFLYGRKTEDYWTANYSKYWSSND